MELVTDPVFNTLYLMLGVSPNIYATALKVNQLLEIQSSLFLGQPRDANALDSPPNNMDIILP